MDSLGNTLRNSLDLGINASESAGFRCPNGLTPEAEQTVQSTSPPESHRRNLTLEVRTEPERRPELLYPSTGGLLGAATGALDAPRIIEGVYHIGVLSVILSTPETEASIKRVRWVGGRINQRWIRDAGASGRHGQIVVMVVLDGLSGGC